MGWVVDGAVIQLRDEHGTFRRREWRHFLAACGICYTFDYLPEPFDAVLFGNTIIFRDGMSDDEIAHAAYHEAWHQLKNAGDVRWWSTRPQGRTTVDKWESRAELFAELFPIDHD